MQAVDCLSNSITQANFLHALFWVDQQWTAEAVEEVFLNFFRFFLFELQHELNVAIIDMMHDYLFQTLKQSKYANKDQQLKLKDVPKIISN
jgi:hypothetical protein